MILRALYAVIGQAVVQWFLKKLQRRVLLYIEWKKDKEKMKEKKEHIKQVVTEYRASLKKKREERVKNALNNLNGGTDPK